MTENEPRSSMSPREKTVEYIRLIRENTVLPQDDVNLSEELFRNRIARMTLNNVDNNESLREMEDLLGSTQISNYLKSHLVEQLRLGMIWRWPAWDDEAQKGLLKNTLSISLEENMYGIFDSSYAVALRAEANYYYHCLPIIETTCALEEKEEWGSDIMRRVHDLHR